MSDNQILNIEDATIFHHFKTILNNVNFQLKIGEFAYIIGETGSGKSSLLRTIYSDIPLKMGKIIVDGTELSENTKNNEASDADVVKKKVLEVKDVYDVTLDNIRRVI